MRFISKFLCSIFAVAPAILFAGTTTVDLYRGGNSTSPRMDNARAQDAKQELRAGETWVLATTTPTNNNGGISTNADVTKLSAPIWKLPKGSTYPERLKVRNNADTHWQWEPAVDMKLTEYQSLLASTHPKFIKQ